MAEADRKFVYLGHPVSNFNTPFEARLVAATAQFFGFTESQVENPNQPRHQQGYKSFKEETGDGMEYFFQMVLSQPSLIAGAFLPFEDGRFGSGVYREAEHLRNQRGRLIYEVDYELRFSPLRLDPSRKLSVDETREYLRYRLPQAK